MPGMFNITVPIISPFHSNSMYRRILMHCLQTRDTIMTMQVHETCSTICRYLASHFDRWFRLATCHHQLAAVLARQERRTPGSDPGLYQPSNKRH